MRCIVCADAVAVVYQRYGGQDYSMKRILTIVFLFCASSQLCAQAPDTSNIQALQQEIDQLQKEIESLKEQYAGRVASLEEKLAAIQNQQASVRLPVAPDVAARPEAALAIQPQQQPAGADSG